MVYNRSMNKEGDDSMIQMKGKQLREVLEDVHTQIEMHNDCVQAIDFTWTIYGWNVEVSIRCLDVNLQELKWDVESAMEQNGLELNKLTIEI